MYLDCGLDCRLVWLKLRPIEDKRCLSWRYILLELLVNKFMQISVDIQWAHRDKALRDDPNEIFPVFYCWLLIKYRWRQAVCPTDFSMNQLLPENINDLFLLCGGDFWSRARQWIRSCFTDVHFWTSIDANVGCKMNVCIFCSFTTQISFFCNSGNLFKYKCNYSFEVKLNYKHRLCGDFRTRGQTFNNKLCL